MQSLDSLKIAARQAWVEFGSQIGKTFMGKDNFLIPIEELEDFLLSADESKVREKIYQIKTWTKHLKNID